ncbi:Broad specificity phosphatase PhoE [Natronincola peptidivorans]|uniref:Broad specificity phosphatase PhoE n=1 Tax=Natronincola peptidivorans TaxID=426128 RepID=A0A1I0DZD5_9FIRM|nr:phosphoglycerate mutase family protein [Natronincola peptidivorans]SET37404.1 Broad specificity phosphatase PhoE [Natronincola peptidivorans]
MKIGLMRHFKVDKPLPEKRMITPTEVNLWYQEYETAAIVDGKVDLGNIEWKNCFSSDLSRAVSTAKKIYNGNIIVMEELRELQPDLFVKRNIKLPFVLWLIIIRVRLFIFYRLTEDFRRKLSVALDKILESQEDVLIVSHGFVMIFMRRELIKRGFKGPSFKSPVNGKLYIFEK